MRPASSGNSLRNDSRIEPWRIRPPLWATAPIAKSYAGFISRPRDCNVCIGESTFLWHAVDEAYRR